MVTGKGTDTTKMSRTALGKYLVDPKANNEPCLSSPTAPLIPSLLSSLCDMHLEKWQSRGTGTRGQEFLHPVLNGHSSRARLATHLPSQRARLKSAFTH